MTEYVRLGDYISIIHGVSYSPKDVSDEENSDYLPILRANNIQNGKIVFDDLKYVLKSKIKDVQLLKSGDIVVCSSSGSKELVGKSARVDNDYRCSFGAFCKLVRISKGINSAYLGHYFSSPIYRRIISESSHGANINNLRNEHIENLQIPLPSLEEQKRIAAALDKMSSVIAKRKRQIELLDEAAKSLFVEMFGDPVENPMGWDVVELKKLSTKIGSGSTPKGGSQSYVESGISLIRSLNVYNNRFKIKDLAHITPEQAKKLDNVTLQKNDVLINITGASVARSCIVPDDVLPARVNQHVSIIRCIPSVLNPIYLNYFLTDGNYQHILLSVGEDGGATREAITKSQLEALGISLPPIDLQNLFAARIEALEAERASCERGLKQMETAFAAMMQEYFG